MICYSLTGLWTSVNGNSWLDHGQSFEVLLLLCRFDTVELTCTLIMMVSCSTVVYMQDAAVKIFVTIAPVNPMHLYPISLWVFSGLIRVL